MNKEDLIQSIENICNQNTKAVKYSIIRKCADIAEQYAQSQTESLKKEIEELELTDDLKEIINEINYIKGLVDNKRYTNAELSFEKLSEQIKQYIGI